MKKKSTLLFFLYGMCFNAIGSGMAFTLLPQALVSLHVPHAGLRAFFLAVFAFSGLMMSIVAFGMEWDNK